MRHIVGGALFKNGRLLVAKRVVTRTVWPGLWEIPGGRTEIDETDECALIREFLEETGLNVAVKQKYATYVYDYEGKPWEENDFIVESESYDVKIDSAEHSEFRWVSEDDIGRLKMSEEMPISMKTAFEAV